MTQKQRDVWRTPTHVTDNSDDFFDEEGNAGLLLDQQTVPFARREVLVTWRVDGSEVTARLKNRHGSVVVDTFELRSGEDGLPTVARRLPSDGAVIKAVQGGGVRARYALRWLLGSPQGYVAAGRELLAAGRELDGSLLEDALDVYLAELTKRPRSRVTAEVAIAKELLQQQRTDTSIRTADIIRHLMAQNITESTAWRRLRKARDELDE